MLCRGETWTYNSGFGDGLGYVNCPPGLILGDLLQLVIFNSTGSQNSTQGFYVPALIRLATPARNVCRCCRCGGLKRERPLHLPERESRDRSDQHRASCHFSFNIILPIHEVYTAFLKMSRKDAERLE